MKGSERHDDITVNKDIVKVEVRRGSQTSRLSSRYLVVQSAMFENQI